MSYITVTQWQDAAIAAFTRAAGDMLGIKRKSDLRVVTNTNHPTTAAVSWSFGRDAAGKIESASISLYLPAMKPGAKLTRRDADALAGLWIHELMHVLCTDPDAWRDACYRGRAFAHIVNGLEDVRGEGELLSRNCVPGAARCLVEMTNRMVWRAPVTPATVNAQASFAALLAYLGRAELLGYDLANVPAMWAALTPSNRATVRAMLDGLKTCRDTSDVVDLVARFFAGEMDQDGDQQDGDQQDGDGDQQDGDQQDGDQQDGDQQDGDQQDGDQQDGDQQDGDGDQQDGDQQDGEPGNFRGMDQGGEMDNAEPSEGAEDIARDVNGGDLDWLEGNLLGSSMATRKITGRGLYGGHADLDRVDGTAAMKGAVRRLIVSPERYGWQAHLERGRLDPRALHRARMGQKDIYRRVDQDAGHTAAVSLVLDLSGSMGGKVRHQAAMAYQVAAACEAAGAPVAVYGFTSKNCLSVIKGYGGKARVVRDRFVSAMHCPAQCTPLAPSIMQAGKDLAAIEATDKVLFVLTDGQDDGGAGRVRRAIRMVREMDIRVVGVVISWEGDKPGDYGFDAADAAIACAAPDLGGKVMGQLADLFEGKKTPNAA